MSWRRPPVILALLVGRSLLARAAGAANEFDQAVGLYGRYLSAQPDDTNAPINFGIALVCVGETSNAVETLRRATERERQ